MYINIWVGKCRKSENKKVGFEYSKSVKNGKLDSIFFSSELSNVTKNIDSEGKIGRTKYGQNSPNICPHHAGYMGENRHIFGQNLLKNHTGYVKPQRWGFFFHL